ncbi:MULTISPECIES: MarR family winged helix-turn-helix transcriptional regulator [unclassified Leifsonia]|uniref:MarR family winged helix-turn-helix transcriptional regulator n=1 Tax=unclassified Leifsonia TaxID=2663824 RepID=UPI000929254F|nr:MarR family transcriptional regulator [Leifsonia sp. 71-9]OJX72898.1 MAG: MarR family transcriptional regulator [Leifsonia sp. 71-9]
MTDRPDDALVDALVQTSFVVTGVLTRVAAERDLSLTQLRMLGVLRDRRPRMAQLAALLGLDKSTVSGLIERAERRGLVRRVPSADDARAVEVVATPDGLALARDGAEQVGRALQPLLSTVDGAGRTALTRELERMLSAH